MKILWYYVCMPNFMIRTFLILEIWGKKGSKTGVFRLFSKNIGWIWFILLGKEDIIILRVHAKFHDQNTSGSWDIGAKVIKNKGLPYLTKVVITRERLKISFNIMAFLESAWNLQSIEHQMSSPRPLFREIKDFKDFVFLPKIAERVFST